jgi:hypothetical protein
MSEKKNINLIPGLALQTLHVSQNDVGRTLVVELFEGSSAYAIPADATATIEGTKQSTLGFKVTGVISTNSAGIRSVVTFVTTKEMTDEWGEILTEIKIKKGTTQLGTANFILSVERDPHPETTTDGSIDTLIPEITALVRRVEAAVVDADRAEAAMNGAIEAKEAAETAAELAQSVLTISGEATFSVDEDNDLWLNLTFN